MMDRPQDTRLPRTTALGAWVLLGLLVLGVSPGHAWDAYPPTRSLMPVGHAGDFEGPALVSPSQAPSRPPDKPAPISPEIIHAAKNLHPEPQTNEQANSSQTRPRSSQLELIAREADMHTRRGFVLAGRKAYHSARFEFIKALRLVAQGLDAEQATRRHSEALASGLRAMEEAEDFLPQGSRLEADLNMPAILGGHQTPVLKDALADRLSPMIALRRYFTYAQTQFHEAAGEEIAGSMALYALGKLHTTLAEHPIASIRAAEPKAMTFFQAALLVHPGNFMAANDLGVLLGRAGRFEHARKMLEFSVKHSPQPATWRNLAKVYQQLGLRAHAEQAEHYAQSLDQTRQARLAQKGLGAEGRVHWVDPSAFGVASTASVDTRAQATPPAQSEAPEAKQESKSTFRWPKWW